MGYAAAAEAAAARAARDTHYRWPSPSLPPTLKRGQRLEEILPERRESSSAQSSDTTTIVEESDNANKSEEDEKKAEEDCTSTEDGQQLDAKGTFFSRQKVIEAYERSASQSG